MGNSSNMEVYNNTFTGKSSWAVAFSSTLSTDITDNKIYNNNFYDICLDANFNCGSMGHTNPGIWIYRPGSGWIKNTHIYNNKFSASVAWASEDLCETKGSNGIHIESSNASDLGGYDGLYIYNNILFNVAGSAGIGVFAGQGQAKNVHIYSNTVYHPFEPSLNMAGDTNYFNNVYIKNNIFYMGNSKATAVCVPDPNTIQGDYVIDYNSYYSNRTGSSKRFCVRPGTETGSPAVYTDWTEWKGSYSFDANGFGPLQEPLFENITMTAYDCSAAGKACLNIQSSSDVKDKGNMLGIPYNVDIAGTARPQGVAWDMGAYESNSSLQPPKPATNLKLSYQP
jgi:hypothetical protein